MEDREQLFNELLELDDTTLELIRDIIARAKLNKNKYACDLDRDELSPSQYLELTRQELIDSSLYITKYQMRMNNFFKERPTNTPNYFYRATSGI